MNSFRRLLSLPAALCLVAAPLLAQNASDPAVFHSEASQVIIDLVVTDKSGAYVENLSAKDFHITEDGKDVALSAASEQTALNGPPQYVVLIMDGMRAEDQLVARQNAKYFASHIVGPRRMLALLSYSGMGNMHVDHAPSNNLAELLTTIDAMKASGVTHGRAYASGSRQTGARPRMTGVGSYNPSDGVTYISNSMANVATNQHAPDTMANQNANSDDYEIRALITSLTHIAQSLSNLPGRKSIIFMTPGFHVDGEHQRYFTSLIETANRGNVSFYPLQIRLESGARQSMTALAKETGGITVGGNNDIEGAFKSIAADQLHYYQLGYRPANATPNTCHKIGVKTDRADLVVRARKEYCNYRINDPLHGSATDAELSAHATGEAAGAIPTTLQAPFFYTAEGHGRISLAAQFPLNNFKVEKVGKRFHVAFNILGVASTPDGHLAGRFSDSVSRDFDAKEQAEHFLASPYTYRNDFELPAGAYNFSFVVSPEAGLFGKTDKTVRIDAWDGKALALSALAFSRDVRPAGSLDAEAVLAANRAPLVSNGLQFAPSPNTTFHVGEQTSVYLEVYDPRLASATPPTLFVHMTIIDRHHPDNKFELPATPLARWLRPGEAKASVGLTVPTAAGQLPAGEYRLMIKITGADEQDAAVRTQNFDLLP